MITPWGGSKLLIFLGLGISLTACVSERNYRLLSTLLDGVPTPAAAAETKEAKKKAKADRDKPFPEQAPAAVLPATPVEKPRPTIEMLKTWEEVLAGLPTDVGGGPDWVKAVKDGIIAPRMRLPSDSAFEHPLTLDTIVRANPSDTAPTLDLDVEIIPPSAPFYKVVFPHSSHTIWLNCSSCHPGIVRERGAGMGKILAGEYCGRCHGKVSFDPMTSCARCHVNLPPSGKEEIEADLAKAQESPVPVTPELVERGKTLYLQACAACHGEKGDGQGPLAAGLNPKPRNFTIGKYKFRSTSSSSIPTDADFFRTITRGIPGTAMPSFSMFSYEDRFAISHFIKTFAAVFAKDKPDAPVPIPDPPEKTPELLAEGKKMFIEAECHKCHGETGRGDGPSAADLKDDWGDPIRPFDFTSGRPKSGSTVKDYFRDVVTGLQGTPMKGLAGRVQMKDYYRDLMTGLQGTPMPDYGEVFQPEQAWAVVYYVYSLGDQKRATPPHVKGDILFQREIKPGEDTVVPATFPHWFHRMRVRCAVCHPGVFQMKAGANNITMEAIRAGKFCGKCHPSYPDSKTLAWPVSFDVCSRCHVP